MLLREPNQRYRSTRPGVNITRLPENPLLTPQQVTRIAAQTSPALEQQSDNRSISLHREPNRSIHFTVRLSSAGAFVRESFPKEDRPAAEAG